MPAPYQLHQLGAMHFGTIGMLRRADCDDGWPLCCVYLNTGSTGRSRSAMCSKPPSYELVFDRRPSPARALSSTFMTS